MKKSRFTESQIVAILKEADAGDQEAYACREIQSPEEQDRRHRHAEEEHQVSKDGHDRPPS